MPDLPLIAIKGLLIVLRDGTEIEMRISHPGTDRRNPRRRKPREQTERRAQLPPGLQQKDLSEWEFVNPIEEDPE